MKTTKPTFLEWNNDILVSSLKKINFNIIIIVILDALFYILSGYLVAFWLGRVQEKITAFDLPSDVISLGSQRAQQLVSELRTFYFLIIFSFIMLLLAIIFLASILKGAIWAKTTNTKLNFKLISKFLVLNLIWMGFWFLLVFLISWLVNPPSAPAFITLSVVLGIYFTNTLYTIFMRNKKLKSIFYAVKLNISKIHLFLLPYSVIFLLFYVLIKTNNLFKFKYSTILLSLTMLVYAAVVRYYASALVLEIEDKSKPL